MRIKARRWHSATDLVKSGDLKRDMINTPPVIRIGGKAADSDGEGGELNLKLVLPFHVGDKAQAEYAALAESAGRFGRGAARAAIRNAQRRAAYRTGVTIAQMRKELATITPDEAAETARRFLRGYGRRLSEGLAKAPRIRKRVRTAQASSGMYATH
jgi:hypothetical protein